MKKSLIALAVLAASGAAMAQSSVTLYGVVDLSIVKATGSSAEMSGNGLLNNGNSRLGVRGTEDLGGGLKASFTFEQGINAETGASDAAGTFQRAAWLALSGGFGSVQLGRGLNPTSLSTDPWNLVGGNYSAFDNQFDIGPSRYSSMIMYTTPNLSGFTGRLAYVLKPDAGGNARYDLGLVYENGPLSAAFAYNKQNGSKGNAVAGLGYNFGSFTLGGSIVDPAGPSRGFSLAASAPIGAFTVGLDIARDTGLKSTDIAFAAKYSLSKRTTTYGVIHRDGSAKVTTAGVGIRHNF